MIAPTIANPNPKWKNDQALQSAAAAKSILCNSPESTDMLMKGLLVAIVVIAAAVAVDEQYNFGHYTDGALLMLREIQRSFGYLNGAYSSVSNP
jgi:hypothetical protein